MTSRRVSIDDFLGDLRRTVVAGSADKGKSLSNPVRDPMWRAALSCLHRPGWTRRHGQLPLKWRPLRSRRLERPFLVLAFGHVPRSCQCRHYMGLGLDPGDHPSRRLGFIQISLSRYRLTAGLGLGLGNTQGLPRSDGERVLESLLKTLLVCRQFNECGVIKGV